VIEVRVAEAGELAGLGAVEDAADKLFEAYGIVFPPGPSLGAAVDPNDVLVVGRPLAGFEGERWLADLGERVTLTSKVMERPPRRG
jgi:hypothetical protein